MQRFVVTALMFVFCSVGSTAQEEEQAKDKHADYPERKNFFGIAPTSLPYFTKLSYERSVNKKSSYVLYGKYYHALLWKDITKGWVTEHHYRYYFGHYSVKNTIQSGYIQGKATVGVVTNNYVYIINGWEMGFGSYSYYQDVPITVPIWGVGLDIGARIISGKKKAFFLDFNVGLRACIDPELFILSPNAPNVDEGESVYFIGDKSLLDITGEGRNKPNANPNIYDPGQPASILSSSFIIGFSL